jgi:hypothetical protein
MSMCPLGQRSYVIKIGEGLWRPWAGMWVGTPGKRCGHFGLVAPLFGRRVKKSLAQAGIESDMVVLPAGEIQKP